MYTIIIPHYNIPENLDRLLHTIPQRDDLQVIAVDDCSTVNQESLLSLQDKYPWIDWLTTNQNGGGGKARNIGLRHAKGDWVLFADADDYFTPALNTILNEYRDCKEYDMVFFNAFSADCDTYHIRHRVRHLNLYFNQSYTNPALAESNLRYRFGEPWCKLIRRKLIENNGIHFDEISIHNDTLFSYMCGYHAKDIHIDDRMLYCVTDRISSVSKQLSNEKLITRESVFAIKNKFLRDHDIPVFDDLMLEPFQYLKSHPNKQLEQKLLEIAANNGYSRQEINKRLLIRKIKSKLRTAYYLLRKR